MARLPSAENMGGLPSASSGRQISSIDGSGIGQGMQNMASGMRALAQGQEAQGRGFAQAGQQVARGIDTFAQSFKVDDDLNDAQTRADFMSEMSQIRSERENEYDPAKLDQFPQRFESVRQKYAQKYGDPLRARKFLIETQDDLTKATIQTNERKIGIERNAAVGRNVEALERLKKEALTEKDEAEKSKRIATGSEIYDGMARTGLMTPAQAFAAKQRWVKDYVITDNRMRSPEQRAVALHGNDGALELSESRGNPRAENKFGFAGLFQFGAPRVAHLGVYTPGPNENLKTFNDTLSTAPGKWSGTFNIPGFPGVRTKADFLADPAAQRQVYKIHQEKISQEIKANGFDKYIGQTMKGVPITENGLRNMLHLGGVTSTKLFLTSGGTIDRPDDNGTTLSKYAAMGASSSPSKMLEILDPAERQELAEETSRELMRKASIAEQEQRATTIAVESERKGRIDTLEVGIMDDTMTRADFLQARATGVIRDEPETIRKIEGLLKQQEERFDRRALSDGIVNRTTQYNPTNPEHVKALEERVEFAARATGKSKEEIGAEVYNQTGLMPKAVVQSMRGRLVSGKEEDIIAVGEMAAKAMYGRSQVFETGNPRAFDGFDGGKEISDIGVMWAHFRDMMPKETDPDGTGAARRIMELRDPKFTSGVKMDGKEELEFKKNIKETALKDFKSADVFGSGLGSNQMPPDGLRAQMEENYAAEVLHYYKKHGGNEDLAREFGKKAIKALYGVSNGVLQKFPVEKALPNMQIPGSGHKWVYDTAAERVRALSQLPGAKNVKPEDVFLSEIPLITSNAFRTQDQGVQYEIVYRRDVGNGQKALDKLYGTFVPAQHFAKAYGEYETKLLAPVYAERANLRAAGQQQERLRQGQVTLDDVPSVGVVGKRPLPPAEREAMRQGMETRVNEVRGLYPNAAKLRDEKGSAVAAEGDGLGPGLQGVADWVKSTPANPLKGFVKSNSRNRLPGGDK